ncbi:unnamed protein product [Cuscuta campestris]|uniref:Uncharacterized protein n=1 Tax=Cuscuta campestris TaxID=132261 RepID=A0A484L8M8_9ASTE|nr:unnamed protein product [Cuscuta campestris]
MSRDGLRSKAITRLPTKGWNPIRITHSGFLPHIDQISTLQPIFHGSICIVPSTKPLVPTWCNLTRHVLE